MYYLYILYSFGSDIYYLGHSDNPLARFIQHNNNEGDTFTGKHKPWELVAVFECGDSRSQALEIERFIKKQKSRILIKKLIDPLFVPKGKLAQLVRVSHVRD